MGVLVNCLRLIQNGVNTNKEFIFINKNKLLFRLLDFLVLEGFINSYTIFNQHIKIYLKYMANGTPVCSKFTIISKVSRRVYLKMQQQYLKSSLTLYFVLTNSGYRIYTNQKRVCKQIISLNSISGQFFCLAI
jgi:ribosomal protein S8